MGIVARDPIPCPKCHGGRKKIRCPKCAGEGLALHSPCRRCAGEGFIPCPTCGGECRVPNGFDGDPAPT
jgi:hypothetical protein